MKPPAPVTTILLCVTILASLSSFRPFAAPNFKYQLRFLLIQTSQNSWRPASLHGSVAAQIKNSRWSREQMDLFGDLFACGNSSGDGKSEFRNLNDLVEGNRGFGPGGHSL